jgi:hypothetical protein
VDIFYAQVSFLQVAADAYFIVAIRLLSALFNWASEWMIGPPEAVP